MLKRINEIKKCLQEGCYEAALALSLTLPDICGQVEYPNDRVGIRYKNWIKTYIDQEAFYDSLFGTDFVPLNEEDIYQLRCSFLHSGDDDIKNTNICEFSLLAPQVLGVGYGYRYGIKTETDGTEIHTAEIDIKYLCDMLCTFAEKYYNSKKPEDFENHSFILKSK